MIGYNHINFDFPYIMQRAKVLNIKNFGHFSRIKNHITTIRDTRYLSKAMGYRDTKEIGTLGRL